MTTADPNAHVIDLIEAYLAGGLSAAERVMFEAHLRLCAACAAAVAQVERADAALRELFGTARPDAGFEDRLIGGLRAGMGRQTGRKIRTARPRSFLHPMVRLAASGVAAAVILGAVGFGASKAVSGDKSLSFVGTLPKFEDGKFSWNGVGDLFGTSRGQELRGIAFQQLHRHAGSTDSSVWSKASSDSDGDGIADRALPSLRTPAALAKEGRESLLGRIDKKEVDLRFGEAEAVAADPKDSTTYRWGRAGSPSAGQGDGIKGAAATGKPRDYFRREELSDVRAGWAGAAASHGSSNAQPPVTSSSETRASTDLYAHYYLANGRTKQNEAGEKDVKKLTELSSDDSRGTNTAKTQWALTGQQNQSGPGNAWFDYSAPSTGGAVGSTEGFQFGVDPARLRGLQTATTSGPVNAPVGGPGAVAGAPGAAVQPGYTAPTGVTKLGAGTVELAYTGGTTVTNGTLIVQGGEAKGKKTSEESAPSNNALARLTDATSARPADVTTGKEFTDGEKPNAERSKLAEGKLMLGGIVVEGEKLEKKGEAGDGKDHVRELTRQEDRVLIERADPVPESGPKPAPAAAVDGTARPDETKPKVDDLSAAKTPDPKSTNEPEKTPLAVIQNPETAKPARVEPQPQVAQRKIIRNGDMAFEVDSFDSSAVQIAKIVGEEQGYVSTTDSEKLPNGKVKGSIIVRVPPERLDTFVLKLRGLGDLKSQKIAAQDVTKHYSDIESQLRAGRAMEERLLDIIKNGKGQVKDLLEAEKQLGVWREKIEALEGEIRYMNNLVSMSTLTITLYERDIKTPSAAAEVETVDTSMETEDVEKARADALKEIDQLKGRIVQAELRQHGAGQFSSLIIAEIPPDASGPLVDRLKQIGKVTRLEITRKRETTGGVGPITPNVKLERKDTRVQISLTNLAAVMPRQTTKLDLAAEDVEKSYKTILDQVTAAGGRIVSSQLNRPKPDQTVGKIEFHAATEKADLLLTALRGAGEVMRMDLNQNQDVERSSEAKRGFTVEIRALATVQPRESTTIQLAAPNVTDAYNKLIDALKAGGARIGTSQLNEQDVNNISAQLEFDTSRENWPKLDTALREAGVVVTRSVARSQDAENTVDSKIHLSINLFDAIRLNPRELVNLKLATRTVPESFNQLLQLAQVNGGKVIRSQLNLQEKTNPTGEVRIQVSREAWPKLEAALKDIGMTVSRNLARSPDGPMTAENKVGLVIIVQDERSLAPRETVSETVVTTGVTDRYQRVLEMLRSIDAQLYETNLTDAGSNDITGTLDFAIRKEDRAAVEKALQDKADVFNRNVQRPQDTTDTLENKVRMRITLKDAERQPPRVSYVMAVEVPDVEKAVSNLEAAALAVNGRRLDGNSTFEQGRNVSRVVIDVPQGSASAIIDAVRQMGNVTVKNRTMTDSVPDGTLARARVEITLGTPDTIRTEKSLWSSVREGLSTSAAGLLWSLQLIIVGLCLVVPWILVLWIGWRITRSAFRKKGVSPATVGPTPLVG